MKVIQCSIRNLKRFDTLKNFIDNLKPDVIIVTESWLNDVHFEYYKIRDYQALFSDRKDDQSGGGVEIL